jgi:erythronate-4-phosphate dehydrogenase
LPIPETEYIQYDANGKQIQEIFHDLVKITYDIYRDDKLLRSNPDDFENLRGNYLFRREFGAYTFKIVNLSEEFRKSLNRIGFKVI